ncbi:7TM-DISM domain-containing protein [Sphingobacterium sp. BS-2]|uniref:sensor histidine kinase n=1 Tax=Sphingobacterium sp. BS-2 TaxID=3377129 RepID=UPI0038FCDC0A
MKLHGLIWTMAVSLLFVLFSNRLEAQTILLPDTAEHLNIASSTAFYYDRSAKDSLPAENQFQAFQEPIYNFGKEDGNLWVRINLANQDSVARNLYLEFTNPNLNSLTLYKKIGERFVLVKILGSSYPFSNRTVKHQNLIFSIELQPLEIGSYYVKVHSDYSAINFNLLLWDKHEREAYYLKETTTISYFFFITTAFLFILGITLVLTKERKQWAFFFYILFGACYIYSDLGLSYKYLWGEYPSVQNISSYIFTNLYLIFGVSFFREYFVTRRFVKKLDRILWIFVLCSLLLTFIAMFYQWIPHTIFSWIQKLNTIMFSITCGIILYILVILLTRQRNKTETIWFMIAFAPHAYTILTTSIRQLGQYYFNLELDVISKVPFFLWTIHVQNLMLWSMVWEVLIVFTLMMLRLKKMYEQHNAMLLELGKKQEEDTKLLMATVEQERKRIAQELHDSSGVQLSAIRMKLTHLQDQLDDPRVAEDIHKLMQDVDRVNADIRTISHNLMPISLSKLGLKAAIQELVNHIKSSYPNIKFNLFQQYDSKNLSANMEVHIYMIIQELLNNMVKHAQATEINIQLIDNESELIISLEDNGKGFVYAPENTMGLGLKSILTRSQLIGGKFEVDSKLDAGSFFSITLPLKA